MNLETLFIDQTNSLNCATAQMLSSLIGSQTRQRELSSEVARVGAFAQSIKPKPLKTFPAKPKYQKGDNGLVG